MCDLYEIILIIIIIILGQILLSYIANTSRTHARTHACMHARPYARTLAHTHLSLFMLSLFDGSVTLNCDGVNANFRRFSWRSMAGRCIIQINTCAGATRFPRGFGCFSRINKLLGRTERRTRDSMCFQSIRRV